MKVQALQSFEHGGPRWLHAEFEVSDATGEALARKGLVKIIDPATKPDGADQSDPPAPKPDGADQADPPAPKTPRRVKLAPEP